MILLTLLKVVPSIEEQAVESFKAILEKVVSFAPQIQLDFNDGLFLNFKTVTLDEVADLVRSYTDRVFFEAHLMVAKPLDHLTAVEKSGVRRVIFQLEKEGEMRDSIETFIKFGCSVGLAVSPESSVLDTEPFWEEIDVINIMAIHPGKQGQTFMPENLDKVKKLREAGFLGEIEVDGGIDENNIKLVLEAGADVAVVGHAIVKAEDPGSQFGKLVQLV